MAAEKYSNKILIVEDEKAMQSALVDNLENAGFAHILTADNGEAGLTIALKEAPDLILLDIVMPKMDGMTMLQKFREDPRGKNTKVILLTNLTANDSIMKGVVSNEPSFYLIKTDYSIDDVIQKVKTTLGLE